eukprot:gnl/Chilomastix_cuspidata/3017.p2 GENE.gnl/Chilomastix_cuspidata/3017~~gnl/Chilomastix_cuspidata/3017.p2  ORF type:complete len:123 (-),score=21.96 gnl/Chilomastix_cuspidata/3017:25-393(-)
MRLFLLNRLACPQTACTRAEAPLDVRDAVWEETQASFTLEGARNLLEKIDYSRHYQTCKDLGWLDAFPIPSVPPEQPDERFLRVLFSSLMSRSITSGSVRCSRCGQSFSLLRGCIRILPKEE